MFRFKLKSKRNSKSLSAQAIKRLKKNKLAMAGLYVIILAAAVALFGPLIRPDSTPKANDQSLEIAIKKPGFSVQVLRVRKNKKFDNSNIFYQLIYGRESRYTIIPIYNYEFKGSNILVEKYTGDEINKGEIIEFNLADVVYPLNYNKIYSDNEGEITFYRFDDGEKVTKTTEELRDEITEDNLVERTFLLGTDRYGRDMLSRLMAGTWISLLVGFIAVFISVFIGIFMGAVSGFFRGKIDDVIMWVINVVWSIPTLLLVIAITLVLGKEVWVVFVAVGLTMWVEVARVVRGQVLSLREKEFIEAGHALGFGNVRILFRHVLPNVMAPVIVISAANFASAILIEAGLSFLGLGAQPPQATWGKMISEHKGYIITGDAYLAVLPGIAIMIMVLAFLLIGNGLRDALDSTSVEEVSVV